MAAITQTLRSIYEKYLQKRLLCRWTLSSLLATVRSTTLFTGTNVWCGCQLPDLLRKLSSSNEGMVARPQATVMPTIPPYKNLQRFSPQVSNHLTRITSSLGKINAADIWPASAEALRFSAQVGTIHYSTLIEGNRLGPLQAERAARGELDASSKAEIELINYVDALKLIDDRMELDGLDFSEDLFKSVHYETTKGLGHPELPFKPHHEGDWRDGEAGVWDEMAQAMVHVGSPQPEVRDRMLGLIEWVKAAESRPIDWPVPVVAGVVHYNIAEVHPFADGNGRTARLLTSSLLVRHGLVPGRLFNFEAHYGQDKSAYLAALRSVRRETLNLETWIRYFLDGLADEYERVEREIDRLGEIGRTSRGEQIQLSESQQRGLSSIAIQNRSEFTRKDYEAAAGVGRSTASKDLALLSDRGVLRRIGGGAQRRYRFAATPAKNPWSGPSIGRPRHWTDDLVEAELKLLVGDETRFPTIKEFDAANKRPLYEAIQRHGGSRKWAERLGLEPPRRGATAKG